MRSVVTWLPGVSAAVDSVGDPVDEHGGDEQWDVKQIKQVLVTCSKVIDFPTHRSVLNWRR